MQPQASANSASPAPVVSPPERKPQLVPPRVQHRRSRWKWWLAGAALVSIIAAVLYWRRLAAPSSAGSAAGALIRTATVTTGTVERTLRLTGVTGAENFASLIAPQLRGSQSGRGRDFSADSSSSSTTAAIPSLSGGNSSSASSSSSSPSTSVGTSGGSGGQNNLSSA